MQKINFQNLPSTSTPLNATNMNAIQTNVENVFNGTVPAGNMVVESIRSKNIFGNWTILKAWINATQLRVDPNTGNRLAFIECKANTTYTISRSVITSTFRVSDYTTIPTQTSSVADYTIPTAAQNNSGTSITYTTSASAKYLIVHYGNTVNDSDSLIAQSFATIQVEEGSTATTYAPYEQLGRPQITTGNGTINSTYIDTVENNHYEKSGNLVSYSFTMKTKGTWGTTTEFISGLPKAKQFTRFIGINTSNGTIYRFEVYTNGTMHNAYSSSTPASGNTIEGHVVYMTED